MPEDDGAEWDEASPPEPTIPATVVQLPGSEYHQDWAHVDKIASLGTNVSALTAADAIAMDVLETATRSLPAICALLAAQAVAPFGTQRDTDHEAGLDMAPRLCKPLMQVSHSFSWNRRFKVTAQPMAGFDKAFKDWNAASSKGLKLSRICPLLLCNVLHFVLGTSQNAGG